MGFFDTVQAFFMELTGRGIVLSSRDAELLFRWRAEGATTAVICQGIERAIAARGEPPRDIWSCRAYVEPLVEQARGRNSGGHAARKAEVAAVGADASASTGARQSSGSKEARAGGRPASALEDDLEGFVEGDLGWEALRTIAQAGQSCEDDGLRRVYRAAYLRVKNALENHRDRLFTELVAADEALLEGFLAALSRDERAAVEARLADQDPSLLKRMSAAAREQHLRARRRKLLAEMHGLVSLLD